MIGACFAGLSGKVTLRSHTSWRAEIIPAKLDQIHICGRKNKPMTSFSCSPGAFADVGRLDLGISQ